MSHNPSAGFTEMVSADDGPATGPVAEAAGAAIQKGTASRRSLKRDADDQAKQGKRPKGEGGGGPGAGGAPGGDPMSPPILTRQQVLSEANVLQSQTIIINAFKLRLKYAPPNDRARLLEDMNQALEAVQAPTRGRSRPSATSDAESPSATSGAESPSATLGAVSPSATPAGAPPSATSAAVPPSATSSSARSTGGHRPPHQYFSPPRRLCCWCNCATDVMCQSIQCTEPVCGLITPGLLDRDCLKTFCKTCTADM
jgi:hypothetical protein